jgi:hypothetical protein
MSKRDEYLKQAEQCRSAARQMSLTLHREQLIAIAENWERLATEADEPGGGDAERGVGSRAPTKLFLRLI